MRRSGFGIVLALTLTTLSPTAARAQSFRLTPEEPAIEIGAQLVAMHFAAIGEAPVGVGLRGGYRFAGPSLTGTGWNRFLTIEAEADRFLSCDAGCGGEKQLVVGVKSGLQNGPIGVFAKVRPGVIWLGPAYSDHSPASGRSRGLLDLGLGLERQSLRAPHVGVRFEIGDTIVFFGRDAVRTVSGISVPGRSHNVSIVAGVFARF